MSDSVKVLVRFRPINERERGEGGGPMDLRFTGPGVVQVVRPERSETFTFDRVYPMDTEQAHIYETSAAQSIDDVLRGFNATIFAYGQTGAGKSFTMLGPEGVENRPQWGIIPRAAEHIFRHINSGDENVKYSLMASYLEIYMEKVNDLLDPSRKNLSIHENPARGVFVKDLSEEYVACEQDVLDLLEVGLSNRVVMATQMNAVSSRSHSVFVLMITSTLPDGTTRTGRLNLVDLAGSERAGKTGATGLTFEQGTQINLSLSCLGNCIKALTSKGRSHVPFRDSKLTRILQESLGGNCKTTLMCACSPHSFNAEETMDTLRFAKRAKTIQTAAKANVQRSAAELERIVANLKKELAEMTAYANELERLVKWYQSPDYVPGSKPPFDLMARPESVVAKAEGMTAADAGGASRAAASSGGAGDDDVGGGGGGGGSSGEDRAGGGVGSGEGSAALSEQLMVAEKARMEAQNRVDTITEELSVAKQTADELRAKEAALEAEASAARHEANELRAALERARADAAAELEKVAFESQQMAARQETATAEVQQAERKAADMQRQLEAVRSEKDSTAKRLHEVESESSKASEELAEAKRSAEEAVAKAAAASQRMKEVQQELGAAKTQASELERETEDLHEYVTQLESEKDQFAAEAAEAQAQCRVRTQQMHGLESSLKAAQAQAHEFEEQVAALVAERDTAIGRSDAEVKKYKQIAVESEGAVRKLKADMQRLEADAKLHDDVVLNLKTANADLERTVGTLQASIHALRQRGATEGQLSADAAEQRDRIERLAGELRESALAHAAEMSQLQERQKVALAAYEDQLRQVRAQRDQLQTQVDGDVAEMRANLLQAQQESKAFKRRAEDAEAQVQKLRAEVTSVGDRSQQAVAACERLKLENAQLEARARSEESRVASTMKRLDERTEELSRLQAAHEDLKIQVATLRAQLEKQRSSLSTGDAATVAEMRKSVHASEVRIAELQHELRNAQESAHSARSDVEHYTTKLRAVETSNHAQTIRISQLEEQHRTQTSAIAALQRTRDELAQELEALRKTATHAETEAQALKAQNEALSKRANRAQRVFRPLRSSAVDDVFTRALMEKEEFGQHLLRRTENRFIEEAREQARRSEEAASRLQSRSSADSPAPAKASPGGPAKA